MKTLYVRRNVVNSESIRAWAKQQGFDKVVPNDELHCTLAFSKKPVDWSKISLSSKSVVIPSDADRAVSNLGDKGAVVLRFSSSDLETEWQYFRDRGASWDYDGFKPHITITYVGSKIDLNSVKPYTDRIVLGPQIRAVVDTEWAEKLKED